MAQDHKSNYVLTAEDRTRQAFASLEKSFKNTERAMSTLSRLTAGAFSVAGLVAFMNKNAEAERASNRLTAVINAQGHAAGFTRGQLDEMADSLAAATQFDDEDFRNAEATLLKFGNVYGDVFKRALKASADLAAFQGTDLSSGIEAVGKALQSPVEGIKQLQAQIGKIDPAQRKMLENMVKQNRVVDAQNMLLDILQKKVGGAAEIMNTGYARALSDTTKNFEELIEAIGKTGIVQGTVMSFFNFLNQSMMDIKSIIETGDWFAGLLFLLGGRGHITGADALEKNIAKLTERLAELNKQKTATGTGDFGIGITDKMIAETTAEIENLQEQLRMLGKARTMSAPLPSSKLTPKIEMDDIEIKKTKMRQFLDDIDREVEKIDLGPIGEKWAKAFQIGEEAGISMRDVVRNATPHIDALRDAMSQLREETDRSADRLDKWKGAFDFSTSIREEIDALDMHASTLGMDSAEIEKRMRMAQFDNEVRKKSLEMLPAQAAEFQKLASVLRIDLVAAMDAVAQRESAMAIGEDLRPAFEDELERRKQVIKGADEYVAAVQFETDMMVANTRQRQHMLDGISLELIGLERGSDAWAEYMEKITMARDAQERLNQSWVFGAKSAMTSYLEEVRNVATASEQLFTKAFRGMEDALVAFVQTGKLSFRDLANSIIEDMIRIVIQQQITGPLAAAAGNYLGSIFGAGGGVGAVALAGGGPMTAGRPYWVGEEGPELVVPRSSGTVIPNNELGGGGSVTVHFNVDARESSPGVEMRVMAGMQALAANIVPQVVDAVRRGGAAHRFIRG